MTILFNDPSRYFLKNKIFFNSILNKIIDSKSYILSEEVTRFEKQIEKFLGNGHFISCANGTDAITLAIKSLGISDGEKIIVPSHTAPATILAILRANCIPYFIDVNLKNSIVNYQNIKSIIAKDKFAAIIFVHLYGYGVNVKKFYPLLKKFKIKIIEDCAQSFGSTVNGKYTGTLADAGCFSFFPTKNLNTIGDGGGIWVRNLNLKNKLIALRQYGWNSKRIVLKDGGINSRLDSLHAAFLIHKLKTIKKEIKKKNKIANKYKKYLNSYYKLFEEDKKSTTSYHLFVVRVQKRDKLLSFMRKKNIILGVHYSPPCHKNGILQKYKNSELKNTDLLSKEVVSLPMFPELTDSEQDYVISKLNEFALSQ